MVFLQPALLWGIAAIIIPVIIHFWYQKKGQTIAWAASQWLTDKTSLQHRGLRLDEILLLLLRCLLIVLFVLLLSKPITEWLDNERSAAEIHLVEPDPGLTENFKFELEQALKKGEKVYWIAAEPVEVKDISALPENGYSAMFLQKSILDAGKPGGRLNLYLRNTAAIAGLPKIYVPESFKLHSIVDSARRSPAPYMQLEDDKRLYIDQETGLLKISSDQTTGFVSDPAHKGKIKVLLEYENSAERQTVQAALIALEEIYSIPFTMDLIKKTDVNYEWILTDRNIQNPDPKILYVVSGGNRYHYTSDNIIQVQDSLRLPTSELVRNGRLPEWFGEMMVGFYKLKQNTGPLSQQQLKALFVKSKPAINLSSEKLHQWLLLFFVINLFIERWIALKKTVTQTYA